MRFAPTLLTTLLLSSLCLVAETRTWTDNQGREVAAELISQTGDSIVLRLANGSEIPFPIERLSSEDREFLSKQPKAETPAMEKPTTTPKEAETPGVPDLENLEKPKDWPTSVSVGTGIDVKEVEGEDEELFVFQTEHFEFRSDAQLGTNIQKEFARLFEAIYASIEQSPLPLLSEAAEEKHVVQLFEAEEDYMKAGGLPNSGGVFMPRLKSVLVPLTSVGVKKVGNRFTIESREDNETLIHEIVHQLSFHWRLNPWWSEGIAEFYAGADYNPGRLKFTNHGDNLRAYLKKKKGVWEKDYTAVHPEDLFAVTQRQWNNTLEDDKDIGLRNYASACILFYFFAQVDADGDGTYLLAFMQAVKAGMEQGEAVTTYLVRDRSMEELCDEITKGCRRHGVDLTFTRLDQSETE